MDLFEQDCDANTGDVLTMSLSCPHNDLTELKALLRPHPQVSPTSLLPRPNTRVTSAILPSPRGTALVANDSLLVLASVSTIDTGISSMVKHPTIHHITSPLSLWISFCVEKTRYEFEQLTNVIYVENGH